VEAEQAFDIPASQGAYLRTGEDGGHFSSATFAHVSGRQDKGQSVPQLDKAFPPNHDLPRSQGEGSEFLDFFAHGGRISSLETAKLQKYSFLHS
jgi:hypothetical protein